MGYTGHSHYDWVLLTSREAVNLLFLPERPVEK